MARGRRRFVEADHPRWPAQTPDSKGGEFRDKTSTPGGWLGAVEARITGSNGGGDAGAPRVVRKATPLDVDGLIGLRAGAHVRVDRGWRVSGARDTLWRGGPFDIELTVHRPERRRATSHHPAGWLMEGYLLNQNGTRKKGEPTRLFIVTDPWHVSTLSDAPWQQKAAAEAERRRKAPLPAARRGPAKVSAAVRRRLDALAESLPADLDGWRSTVVAMRPPEREIDREIAGLEEAIAAREEARIAERRRAEEQARFYDDVGGVHKVDVDEYVARQMRRWDETSEGIRLEQDRRRLKNLQYYLKIGPSSGTQHLFRDAAPKIDRYLFDRDPNGVLIPSKQLQAHLETVIAAGQELERELDRLLQKDREWVRLERDLTEGEFSQAAIDALWKRGLQVEYEERAKDRQYALRRQAARRLAVIREMLGSVRGFGGRRHDGVRAAEYSEMQQYNAGHPRSPDKHELPPHPDFQEHIRAAEAYYPDDWIGLSSQQGTLRVASRGRAHYRNSYGILATRVYETSRGTSNGFPSEYEETNVHELAHRMEVSVPGLRELEFAYVRARAMSRGRVQRAKKLKTIFPNSGYDADEWAFEDHWADAYAGKTYEQTTGGYSRGGDPTGYHWELLSTGVEDLYGGRPRFDRGMGIQHFTLGVLALLARPPAPPKVSGRRRTS